MTVTIVHTKVVEVSKYDAENVRAAGAEGLVWDDEQGLLHYSEPAGAVIGFFFTTPVSDKTEVTINE